MITEAIMGFLAAAVEAVLGWLPDIPVPGWLSSADGAIGTVFGYAGSMGAWFPTALCAVVVSAVLAAWATGFIIKGVRIVASFFTAGGGSAA